MHPISALLYVFIVFILMPAWSSLSCCKCFRKKPAQPKVKSPPQVSQTSAAIVPENKTPEHVVKSADAAAPNMVPMPISTLTNPVDQVKSNKSKPTFIKLTPVVVASNEDKIKIQDKLKKQIKTPIEEAKEPEMKGELVSNRTAELFMSSAAVRHQREVSVKQRMGSGFYATESQADEDDTLEEYPDPEQEKTEDNPKSKK